MLLSTFFFYFFGSLALISSFFVTQSKNPIFSILFLIFAFANTSCILFLFHFEFLPIAFLIIYVGAIAVLFLFVLMMLNIKFAELQKTYQIFIPVSLFIGFLFIFEIFVLFRLNFPFLTIFNDTSLFFLSDFLLIPFTITDFYTSFGLVSNLKTIAIALFSDYLIMFLVAGYILLLAMVSAIILTVQKKFFAKSQKIYDQILTNYNNRVVFFS